MPLVRPVRCGRWTGRCCPDVSPVRTPGCAVVGADLVLVADDGGVVGVVPSEGNAPVARVRGQVGRALGQYDGVGVGGVVVGEDW